MIEPCAVRSIWPAVLLLPAGSSRSARDETGAPVLVVGIVGRREYVANFRCVPRK